MNHKWRERCDCCGKWSNDYTTIDNGEPKGLLLCDECYSKKLEKEAEEKVKCSKE